jgi:D-glycero-beta-D-manno-heptose-7-phosphate kinase
MKILLLGDDGVDIYQFGDVTKLSPEAPIPVFVPTHKKQAPGMAGNVCRNLETLGCQVTYLSDKTSVKTRMIDRQSRQQLLRIDEDTMSLPIDSDISYVNEFDAVVISDYDKGTIDYGIIEKLQQTFSGPIFVDTKKTDLARLEGCFVKINRIEHERIKTTCSGLIVTLGADGARYKDQIFPAQSIEVIDVCGAGDTFLAALCVGYLETQDIARAIDFAQRASEVTIKHVGVYAPTREEIDEIRR